MLLFDDKTNGVEFIGGHLVLNSPIEGDQIAFKATYYVNSDVMCTGKITCMFDLFVLGNIKADEIDVKGKLVCLGKCEIAKTAIVQNGIWVTNMTADTVQSHENIYAQELDVGTVVCDGKIVIEKTLAVAELARVGGSIICGETAYGSGKVVANIVITGEPIDLDDGEESIVSPFVYSNKELVMTDDIIAEYSKKFRNQGDYVSFLNSIIDEGNPTQKQMATVFLEKLNTMNALFKNGIESLRDTKVLLDMVSIQSSNWFSGWDGINSFSEKLLSHFESLSQGENPYVHRSKGAKDLNVGDYIRHVTYGDGRVIGKQRSMSGISVEIDFNNAGHKKFVIPAALKYFSILGDQKTESPESIKASLKCEVNDYRDWIQSLEILYDSAAIFSDGLYNCIYELLMMNLGLKPKFVKERFEEKGWTTNGK